MRTKVRMEEQVVNDFRGAVLSGDYKREMLPRVIGDKAATERLHILAQLIMCGDMGSLKGLSGPNSTELLKMAGGWRGSGVIGRQNLLERLQSLMPANEML